MRTLVEYRFLLSILVSAVAGVTGLEAFPFPADHPILGLIGAERPIVLSLIHI